MVRAMDATRTRRLYAAGRTLLFAMFVVAAAGGLAVVVAGVYLMMPGP